MRLLFTLMFGSCLALSAAAQKLELVPITRLSAYPQPAEAPAAPKSLCGDIGTPGVNYVIAGDSALIEIQIDTVGLGGDGDYSCVNCDELTLATATVMEGTDELLYIANGDAVAGKEVVEVQYCEAGDCRSRSYHFIARRPGATIDGPDLIVDTETLTPLAADLGSLPGPLGCTDIFDCPDNYEGREQLGYLTDYNTPVNTFIYRSSRYAGRDDLCVVLCDTFTVCDTIVYSFFVRGDTLTLPFMDDFSYDGPFPAATHWLDKDAFINNDLGVRPPSYGVATFDGISRRGEAYGGGYGEADRLTSAYLDLSGFSTGDLVLSFWLQRKGLGNKPEPQDSIILQYKGPSGVWDTRRTFEGAPPNQPNSVEEPFLFYTFSVPDTFRYNGFQFRFTNFSERSGLLDLWHLDYVRLDRNEFDTTFADIAFTQEPASILGRYRSMPWRHFGPVAGEELAQQLDVQLFNHADQALNAAPSAVRIEEVNTGTSLFEVTLFNGQEANILNGTPLLREYSLVDDPTGFPSVFDDYLQLMQGPTFDDVERPAFETVYRLTNASQVSDPGFEAVLRNDTVRALTVFDNYFAYDDGTAEMGLVAGQGTNVAVRYTAIVEDSLRAISIHLPFTTNDVSDQRFNLKVWVGELDNEPEYEQLFVQPFYASNVLDTLQGFTTYPLVDAAGENKPLYLPPGDFYIGWQQETSCTNTQCIPVGYDQNSPGGKEFISQEFGQGWQPIPANFPGGSLMLRPVVGDVTPGFTDTEDQTAQLEAGLRAYPNPANDDLYIALPDGRYDRYRYRLLNAAGRPVRTGVLLPQLSLTGLPAGFYWLEIMDPDSGARTIRKIVRQ